MISDTIEVPPDPSRIIEGLRDTGYDFVTAVADLVDNSVAAHAQNIRITIAMDLLGEIRLTIVDDGCGMDREGLINSMRYGSRRRTDPNSLGKFGLGLKTASTAFCKRLSVSSRASGNAPVLCATWDLDHVAECGKWELLFPNADPSTVAAMNSVAPSHASTAVIWDKVDRLLTKQYDQPAGKPKQNALQKKVAELEEHLAMVYQRFLDPLDARAQNIRIIMNEKPIEAWDPFVTKFSDLVGEDTRPVDLGDGRHASFSVRAYLLPRAPEFPSKEEAKAAKLEIGRQGIYIYRENRLIHDADWNGLYTKELHINLLRVEFSFDHQLDDAFHIDIKKSQIILSEELLDYLGQFLTAPRREANRRSRVGTREKVVVAAQGAHKASNAMIGAEEDRLGLPRITEANSETEEATVENRNGSQRIKIKIGAATRTGEPYVQTAASIDGGCLWEAAILDGKHAVRLNQAHPYYEKVYVPNLASGVLVQGMDSLMWALAIAQLSTSTDATWDYFEDLRYEVSRILGKLVAALPEPDLPDVSETTDVR